MLLVKKYPNRRLYDTRHSRYITLDDLERTIRTGEDVAVHDAQDGRDLTQETLTQIILDRGDGRILPAALLLRLIRLDDAALGEFLTRYVTWALDMYVQAKDRARAFLPMNPLATAPFAAADQLARLVLGAAQWNPASWGQERPSEVRNGTADPGGLGGAPFPPIDAAPAPPPGTVDVAPEPPPSVERVTSSSSSVEVVDEMQRMRAEIDALKQSMVAGARPRTPAKKKAKKRAPARRA